MIKTFYFIPTNKNQKFPYTHTFMGTLAGAKSKVEYITARLREVLTQGSIGCILQDQDTKEIAFLAPSSSEGPFGKWEDR